MTNKKKESEQAETILSILLFAVPIVCFLIWTAWLAYDLHPILGFWVIIVEIAGVNALVKRYQAVKEEKESSETKG
jgi:hypothetical protein